MASSRRFSTASQTGARWPRTYVGGASPAGISFPRKSRPSLLPSCAASSDRLGARQRKAKARPASGVGLHREIAAVRSRNPLRHIEAEAQAAFAPPAAVEALEHVGKDLLRDPGPLVDDVDNRGSEAIR